MGQQTTVATAKSDPRRLNFTVPALDRLTCPTGMSMVSYYDERTPGLTLLVTVGGSKTFYVYRKIDGEPERIKLGRWPDIKIEQARKLARQRIGEIADGRNPNAEKMAARGDGTLGELFERFLTLPTRRRHKRAKAARTVREYEKQFNRYLIGWKDRKLPSIDRNDVVTLHNRIAEQYGQTVANRTLALVKVLYNVAIDTGVYEGENPAARVPMFEEKARERFLQGDELPRFFAALEQEPSAMFRDLFALALLTGARRSNVQAMKWADVHLDRATWTIAGAEAKGHADIVVPLVPPAVKILARRKAEADAASPWVFPTPSAAGHVTEPHRTWTRLLKRAGIEGLRFHDLRRSMGSWMAGTGAGLPMIGKALGHKSQQTTSIYARLNVDPVRDAMTTAATAMMAAAEQPQTKKRKARR